jgi:hypothetical protein
MIAERFGADISILVIIADPAETDPIRDRHVVLEGRYHLFISDTFSSFSVYTNIH